MKDREVNTSFLYFLLTNEIIHYSRRAVARSENLGGHIVLGGDNVPPLVEIGLLN